MVCAKYYELNPFGAECRHCARHEQMGSGRALTCSFRVLAGNTLGRISANPATLKKFASAVAPSPPPDESVRRAETRGALVRGGRARALAGKHKPARHSRSRGLLRRNEMARPYEFLCLRQARTPSAPAAITPKSASVEGSGIAPAAMPTPTLFSYAYSTIARGCEACVPESMIRIQP